MLFPLYFTQLSCAVQNTDICFFLQTGMHKLTENTEELQIINEQRVSLAFELKGYWSLNKVFFMAWTPTLTVLFMSHSLKGMDVPKHSKTCVGILHTRRHDTQRFCLSAASHHIDFTSSHCSVRGESFFIKVSLTLTEANGECQHTFKEWQKRRSCQTNPGLLSFFFSFF